MSGRLLPGFALGVAWLVAPLPGATAGAAAAAVAAPPHVAPAAPQAAAEDGTRTAEEIDALSARVAAELRCPVCRNQSVLESSAELSRQMQGVIRERLAAGDSPEAVKAYFVARYGEWILLQPEPSGLNLVVYLLPALGLLGGGALVAVLLRRWAARPVAPGPPGGGEPPLPGGLTGEDRRWLEEAVRGSGTPGDVGGIV